MGATAVLVAGPAGATALVSDDKEAADAEAGAAAGGVAAAAAAVASATTSGDDRERECLARIVREATRGRGATATAVLDDASGREDAESKEDGDSGGFENENTGARADSERRCRVFGAVAVSGAAAFGSAATSLSIVAAALAAWVGEDAADDDDDDDVVCPC